MKILGLFGKEKPVDFDAFRDQVRLAVRREKPGVEMQRTDSGFTLTLDGAPITCNLRGLYATYSKSPGDKDALIAAWIASLVTAVPEQSWSEAVPTLRPTLKNATYIAQAQASIQRQAIPDSLPSVPFCGDLSVIVMRDLPGTAAAVTQRNLDEWGVTLEKAMTEAVNNMSLSSFPPMTNALMAGGSGKNNIGAEEVGMVFEGDHLTATWLTLSRFRDYVGQRLQGDYVVAVPNRGKLVAVRADEPGLISSVQTSNRNARSLPYALTPQCYHVSMTTTGGAVSVYNAGGLAGLGGSERMDSQGVFAGGGKAPGIPVIGQPAAPGGMAPAAPASSGAYQRPAPIDFSAFGGLNEATGERAEDWQTASGNKSR